jgi:peroxiredoxin
MKNRIFFFVIFYSLYSIVCAQTASLFQYTPLKPTTKEKIEIRFNASGTSFENAEVLDAEVMFLSNKFDSLKTISLSKDSKGWKGYIIPDTKTSLITMKFISGNIEESNGGRGYIIVFYDEKGNPVVNSFASKALLFTTIGALVGIDVDMKQANNIFEGAFKKYPLLKTEYLNDYLPSLSAIIQNKEELENRIKKELIILEQKKYLSDEELYVLSTWYGKINDTAKVNYFTNKALTEYPKGKNAANIALLKITSEKNFDKKLLLIEKYLSEFANTDNYETSLNQIFFGILGQNNIKDAATLLTKFKNTFNPSHYVNLASSMLRSNYNVDTTLVLINESIKLTGDELTSPKFKKLKIISDFLWLKMRESTYAVALQTYAEYLGRNNQVSAAIENYEKSFNYLYSKWLAPQFVLEYFKLLTREKMYYKAITQITSFIEQGMVTDEIKELLKQNYIGKNGNESGFAEFLDETLNLFKKKILQKLEKEILDQPAPQFTLFDLDGKVVSLKDYLGKIIVLDFWATWCGPCIASFPAMKIALEKYEKNGDVKFLFINTQETAERKTEYVKEFMSKKNFSFHVLIDENNDVMSKYKVLGVPTKFVIDKKGTIRFKSSGYYSKPDEFVEEIGAMINLASKY